MLLLLLLRGWPVKRCARFSDVCTAVTCVYHSVSRHELWTSEKIYTSRGNVELIVCLIRLD